jgi:hypothetical protein
MIATAKKRRKLDMKIKETLSKTYVFLDSFGGRVCRRSTHDTRGRGYRCLAARWRITSAVGHQRRVIGGGLGLGVGALIGDNCRGRIRELPVISRFADSKVRSIGYGCIEVQKLTSFMKTLHKIRSWYSYRRVPDDCSGAGPGSRLSVLAGARASLGLGAVG